MKKIGWIQIFSKKYGGGFYNKQAREALKKDFDVDLVSKEARFFKKFRYLKVPEALLSLAGLKGEKDLWVRDFYSATTMTIDKAKGKNLIMIHHIDFSVFPLISRPFLFLLEKIFYKNLKKADFIVTVSNYWQDHFLKKGYKNVYKIYNGFILENYNISDQEVENFKKQNNLSGKPIIYLGNYGKEKGMLEAYKALKGLDVYLITSGKRQIESQIPSIELSHRDYLILLRASSIVVTMSKFKEGWCRTAHEAMLLRTPVIGSGLGGMKELLEEGKQIICKDFKQLREEAEFLLKNPDERNIMGENGYNFAKNFTQGRFNKSWLDLINVILN
jgi:glycosyltransferase involved in cell wall biosynthesis